MTENATPSTTRPMRFGVVAPVMTDMASWKDQVRRLGDSGYSTLLMPDVPQWQPAPAPALAMAAALTDLRVGTWVYASPLRPPSITALEAHSLSQLTEGRFELGIGGGRPGIEDELRRWGLPPSTPGDRVQQMRDTVVALRELDGPDRHTPVVMAVRGPKTSALAEEFADGVSIAAAPGDSRAQIVAKALQFRSTPRVELTLHISVVGDVVAPFMTSPDTDPAAMRAADSLAYLPSDPAAAVEELLRRREEGGFTYVVVGSNSADTLAPVVAELAGR